MNDFESVNIRTIKTIIIGNSGVGKSTFLYRYINGSYNPQEVTLGMDFKSKKIQHQGKTFKLEFWDSAGQQRFKTIVHNYFNQSKAGLVVFDITNQQSLDGAKDWLNQLSEHCIDKIPKILLGNKSDLLSKQALQEQMIKLKPTLQQIKQKYDCDFLPVSALDGTNINESIELLIKKIFQNGILSQVQSDKPKRKQLFKLDGKNAPSSAKQKKKCC